MFDSSVLKGKKILVTGAAGFLGSNLCRRLLREGAEVIAFDDLSTGKKENVKEYETNPAFQFIQGDANRRDDLLPIFLRMRPDFVCHYAALVGVKRTVERPLDVFKDIDGIKHIYELAAASGVTKVIFASSSEAYGEPVTVPEKEDGVWNAKNPYALVKLIGEQFGLSMYKTHGLRSTALRFFNVYGPGQEASDYGFVVGIFIRAALQGAAPTIFGDGLQTRDFVYVDDNIEVAIRALCSQACDGQVMNVGAGRQTTIKELAEQVIKISGKPLTPVYLPARTDGEIRHRCPDVTRCRELVGYVPESTLNDGLAKTFAWYEQRYGITA
jgi:UDP-glucose 4-epimerase